VYKDGKAGAPGASLLTSCSANKSRPDVNSNMGIPGDHGFNCKLPSSYVGSGNHSLYIHAIDFNGTPNDLLKTNGKMLNCNVPVPPPPGGGATECDDKIDNSDSEDNDETNPLLPPIITANGQSTTLIIRAGTQVNIEWDSNGNTNCSLSPQLPSGIVTSGSEIEKPTSESRYTISCNKGLKSVIVKVLPSFQET
jgi:hypothetical protein